MVTKKLRLLASINLAHAALERFILRRTKISSKPFWYTLEASGACNLSCAKCPQSDKSRIQAGFLTYENFCKAFDQIRPYARTICFSNWGEPFLNKQVFRMISACAAEGINTSCSTNLVHKDKSILDSIITSNLAHLTVSIDGYTQDSYQHYRIGGDIETALTNLAYLQDMKKKMNRNSPVITWNFIANRFNQHEIGLARKRARELDVDFFLARMRPITWKEPFLSDSEKLKDLEEWLPGDDKLSFKNQLTSGRRRHCYFPWTSLQMDWNGGVIPCCSLYGQQYYFGNLLNQSLDEVWNGEMYRRSRECILGRENGDFVCSVCRNNNYIIN